MLLVDILTSPSAGRVAGSHDNSTCAEIYVQRDDTVMRLGQFSSPSSQTTPHWLNADGSRPLRCFALFLLSPQIR
jgi:hypothetical protein